MDGQEYRAKLLAHAKERGYGRPKRQGNDWIFTTAMGLRATVEFEPMLTDKSGYLIYAKTRLTAVQNEATGRWPERAAAQLRSDYAVGTSQQKPADEEKPPRKKRHRYPRMSPQDFARYGEALPGEDRSFGGNSFYSESLPGSSWFRNLRSMIPPQQWSALGVYIRDRAGNRCEMCGSGDRLEAHERWQFDETTKTQRLRRVVCVCKSCHLGLHVGLASRLGVRGEIDKHVISVTGWSEERLKDERATSLAPGVTEAWRLDVSIVEACGVTVVDPAPVVAVKKGRLLKEAESHSIRWGEASEGRLDLSTEIRRGMVVFLCHNESDMIGGIDLSDEIPYTAKMPDDLSPDTARISLKRFVAAHNNPVVVWNRRDLHDMLRDRANPRRLVVQSSWVDERLLEDCLKDAIVFSFS